MAAGCGHYREHRVETMAMRRIQLCRLEIVETGSSWSSPLILRSAAQQRVSKDEATDRPRFGLMVRDGARAPPHHEEERTAQDDQARRYLIFPDSRSTKISTSATAL
jgi:hypothetical protein